jgi:hypothetical protein
MAGGSLPSTENDSQKDSREARSPNLWLNRVAQRSSTHSSALDNAFRFIDGMTILFGNAKYDFQDELSSRPERSVVEGSAVRLSAFPNSWA